MKKLDGYEQAEARTGEYEQLPAGGYVCKILQVKAEEPEPDAGKSYDVLLRIGFDIVEGEHAGYFKRQFERKAALNPNAKWPGMYYQTAKNGAEAVGYFKGFITAIEQSNSGFKWDWDERKLKGKLFGGVFGEEEYVGYDGNVHMSVKCAWVRSTDKIRNGDFKIPDKKTVDSGKSHSSAPAPGTEICPTCKKPIMECTCGDDLPF